jgi:diacylglycerol kinase (ATP)
MFKEAISGIRYALLADGKLIWFLMALIAIYMVNVFLAIDVNSSAITILCAGTVYSSEMFNTAIEHLCDRITIQRDYDIKLVKDMSAGAVLFLCVTAVLVAMLVYIPKIVEIIVVKK